MAKMSASLVQATVPAVSKRKLQPTWAALTLTPSAVNMIKQLPKDKQYTKTKGDSDEEDIQDGVRVFIEKKAQLTLLGTEMDYVEDQLSSNLVVPYSREVTILMPYLVRTPDQHSTLQPRTPGLKRSSHPSLLSSWDYRYFYPFPVPPLLYQVELSVGGQQFNGKGKTRQAAKHDAAAKALRILQNEPPPERLEVQAILLPQLPE
ncbi:Iron-sulfur cluster assembly 1-like protein, mitochondrial [Plecturocebus cupreus]